MLKRGCGCDGCASDVDLSGALGCRCATHVSSGADLAMRQAEGGRGQWGRRVGTCKQGQGEGYLPSRAAQVQGPGVIPPGCPEI